MDKDKEYYIALGLYFRGLAATRKLRVSSIRDRKQRRRETDAQKMRCKPNAKNVVL
jgi:hypothetical protein